MKRSDSLAEMVTFLNPGRNSIRVNIIIPMTQKIIQDEAAGKPHIVAFPDIQPENYIFNSFLGGDIVLGKENGIENSILIGNGQIIKFGSYNSLQNLEAHGSDIREVGVEWGDGNFIAHRAIFHGCKGGDRNYLGVGNIVADLSDAGSENYFYHGSTVGFDVVLKNRMAYRGSYIAREIDGNVGPSSTAIEFENQRTAGRIPLGQLFHDGDFRFMRNTIVPRTRNLLAHLSYTLGGYVEGRISKQAAHGVMIQHVLTASEYFHGVFSNLVDITDRALALEITNLQKVYSLFLDGSICGYSRDDVAELAPTWANRHVTYRKGFAVLEELTSNLDSRKLAAGGGFHLIGPQLEKRFAEYKKHQLVVVIECVHDAIPRVVRTRQDIVFCRDKIIEVNRIIDDRANT